MSILIKGIEMPKEPWECPCHNGENGCCNVTQKVCFEIPKDCPLVSVPPLGRLVEDIEYLPPVQPEHEIKKEKPGKWILVHPIQSDDPGAYMCSKCKTGMWEIRPSSYHYCPNCGAYMIGEQDE